MTCNTQLTPAESESLHYTTPNPAGDKSAHPEPKLRAGRQAGNIFCVSPLCVHVCLSTKHYIPLQSPFLPLSDFCLPVTLRAGVAYPEHVDGVYCAHWRWNPWDLAPDPDSASKKLMPWPWPSHFISLALPMVSWEAWLQRLTSEWGKSAQTSWRSVYRHMCSVCVCVRLPATHLPPLDFAEEMQAVFVKT
jgi:hypothetical protein